MRTRTIVSGALLALVLVNLSGCLAVAACVAAGSYSSSVRSEDRAAYQAANTAREKEGLKPLTPEEWKMGVPSGDPAAKASTEKKAKTEKQNVPDPS